MLKSRKNEQQLELDTFYSFWSKQKESDGHYWWGNRDSRVELGEEHLGTAVRMMSLSLPFPTQRWLGYFSPQDWEHFDEWRAPCWTKLWGGWSKSIDQSTCVFWGCSLRNIWKYKIIKCKGVRSPWVLWKFLFTMEGTGKWNRKSMDFEFGT